MADIFISYKREERERCAGFAERLSELGLDVWFDARLENGTSFDAEIESQVRTAKAVLVLWSKASAQSEWVRSEATLGQKRKVLVSVDIEACDRPIIFTNTQSVPLFDQKFSDRDPNWLSVLEKIAALTKHQNLGYHVRILKKIRDGSTPTNSLKRLVATAAVACLIGGAAGFFLRPFLMPTAAPKTALAAAQPADLVGVWGGGDFACNKLAVRLSLESDGFAMAIGKDAPSRERLKAFPNGWFESSGSGPPNYWHRDGSSLEWRAGRVDDTINEVRLTPCAV